MLGTTGNEQSALKSLISRFGSNSYALIGKGKEGYVFSDGFRRYKVFIKGTAHPERANLSFLSNKLGGENPPKGILPVSEIIESGKDIVIVSPPIFGELYKGGHWWGLVELLRECKDLRIALMNIHPDNLIVANGRLMYVDIGPSIVELNESLWNQMVRRAFLSFKYTDDDSLKEMMSKALKEDIPEMNGVNLLFHDTGYQSESSPVSAGARSRKYLENVTLLIRTCYMEWNSIEFQVKHIVSQLESRYIFFEKIVICGPNTGPFNRQYQNPNVEGEIESLERLLSEKVIDRYLITPSSAEMIRSLSIRWFGLDTTNPYSEKGEPTIDSLFGFDQCRTDLILQMDSDVILGIKGEGEYLDDLLDVLGTHPKAVGISIPPPLYRPQPYTPLGPKGKWRCEVRFSLLDRRRLEKLLPLPNTLSNGKLNLSWYRSLDKLLNKTNYEFYRGGSTSIFMIHVPNTRKVNRNEWFNIIKAVEKGIILPCQTGRIDLVGSIGEWIGKREEELVFIVRGWNTQPEKLHRCLESLRFQKNQSFGVLFIDAGSTDRSVEMVENFTKTEMKGRTTVFRNWDQLTAIENIVVSIKEVIGRKNSIVALLDADDALLTDNAVDRIFSEYISGADLTVGSMLRTDKRKYYPVEFRNARRNRGGNVWQHIRTFRRYLFDQIDTEDLKVDGDWIPYAEDWAFMLPMVEMASRPVWIRDKVYLYDPSTKDRKYTVVEREKMVAQICQKKSYLGKGIVLRSL